NGPSVCIIDGLNNSFFAFGESASYKDLRTSIQGFTIRNFMGPGFYYFAGSCPSIINNIIENCNGGGVLFWGGSPSIEKNIIRNNTGSAIQGSSCSARIVTNTITGNTDRNGAGINLFNSSSIIANNLISNNNAEKLGGGLYLKSDTSTIVNNTIVYNSAETGGGIYTVESLPNFTNNIIAHSGNYSSTSPKSLEKWRESSLAVTYSYCSGILCGATLYEGFINKGPAGYITISVWDFGDTTLFVESCERYSLIINCAVQSGYTTTMVSSVVSDFDTLEIESSFEGKHLSTRSLTLISHGVQPAGGIIAVDCEFIEITYCSFFSNSGGDYFNYTIDSSLIDLSGTGGNMVCDPYLNEADYSLTAQSDCIDKGIADTSGLQLPKTDIIGTERILDGNNDGLALIDIGAYEFDNITGLNQKEYVLSDFHLFQNYPNPFNLVTVISYELKSAHKINLSLFDINGRKIKTLVNKDESAGRHFLVFDASGLSGGIYIYRLTSGTYEKKRKMILLP
ncbi:MAG: right-handed parallel beta-helix repeat-containing protein, partial [Calditrichaeota bacterium]|nr:right-handed parallel beta-helix repeat-containing protein [Calditrichota bacterium]